LNDVKQKTGEMVKAMKGAMELERLGHVLPIWEFRRLAGTRGRDQDLHDFGDLSDA
jgi:hypothetical protein